MKMNGARIIIEALIEQGCDTVFGYPGGQVLNIFDELYLNSERLTHIITAHEQGASHAADGYARASGKPGVVIATSGPGSTNIVTGLATAYLDSVPVVAVTGNVPCSLLGRDSFQEVNIVDITRTVTKKNWIVKDVTKLADTIREAFRTAMSGRPGPVLIDARRTFRRLNVSLHRTPRCSQSRRYARTAVSLTRRRRTDIRRGVHDKVAEPRRKGVRCAGCRRSEYVQFRSRHENRAP